MLQEIRRVLARGLRYWAEVLGLPRAKTAPAAPKQFRVLVDDNYDYMDESRRREQGRYDTLEEAIAACKAMVDECLRRCHQPGMTAAELELQYKAGGDDPFIVGVSPDVFSAWRYAEARAKEMCEGGAQGLP